MTKPRKLGREQKTAKYVCGPLAGSYHSGEIDAHDILDNAGAYAIKEMDKALGNLDRLEVDEEYSTGDLVTEMDQLIQDSIVDFLEENNVAARVVGEEGADATGNCPDYLIVVDPIEGTRNFVNNLTHGVNLAIAEYKSKLRVKDIDYATVWNLQDDVLYRRGKNQIMTGRLRNGEIYTPVRKDSKVAEIPSPWSYTTEEDQKERQIFLNDLIYENVTNQIRSIDATGTRLMEIATDNLSLHADWRNATKCWDVLPSFFILQQEKHEVSDILGFKFDQAVFYNEFNEDFDGDNSLNRAVGENFLVVNRDNWDLDHEILFGDDSRTIEQLREMEQPTCIWDRVILESDFEYPDPPYTEEKAKKLAKDMAEVVNPIIDEKNQRYRFNTSEEYDYERIKPLDQVAARINQHFVEVIPEDELEAGPHVLNNTFVQNIELPYEVST